MKEMNPITINMETKEFKNLQAVASMLEALSPNNAKYIVTDVYFDLGQDWMWTTIVRKGYKECQVLSPREWGAIIFADNAKQLGEATQDIIDDKWFGDK